MIQLTEDGDSIYIPSESKSRPISDTRGPLGKWVKYGDSGYDEALAIQRQLEEVWDETRDEHGDG